MSLHDIGTDDGELRKRAASIEIEQDQCSQWVEKHSIEAAVNQSHNHLLDGADACQQLQRTVESIQALEALLVDTKDLEEYEISVMSELGEKLTRIEQLCAENLELEKAIDDFKQLQERNQELKTMRAQQTEAMTEMGSHLEGPWTEENAVQNTIDALNRVGEYLHPLPLSTRISCIHALQDAVLGESTSSDSEDGEHSDLLMD